MIYALIVLYNKACQDSETLKSIQKWKDKMNIIVFDNSTIKNKNDEYCQQEKLQYFSEGQNLGLSKAYNYVIDRLILNENDYVMILADDTVLSDEYLQEVLDSLECGKDILLPVVRCGNAMISPTNIKFKWGSKIVSSVDELDFAYMSAINSGMVVCGKVYKSIRYNEELFLDCIDHEFMREVREHKFSIMVLKNEIVQNFSRNEKPKIESALFRFGLYKKDFKRFCEINNAKGYYWLSISKFILSYSLKYKSLKFLFTYFKK